ARARFDPALRQTQRGYARELDARTGRNHSHVGDRGSGQTEISRRLEDAETLSASGGATEVVRVTFRANLVTNLLVEGSACGPVIVPVFKTGGRHLRCCRCVRLTHASASFQQLAEQEITRKSVHSRTCQVNNLRVTLLVSSGTMSP